MTERKVSLLNSFQVPLNCVPDMAVLVRDVVRQFDGRVRHRRPDCRPGLRQQDRHLAQVDVAAARGEELLAPAADPLRNVKEQLCIFWDLGRDGDDDALVAAVVGGDGPGDHGDHGEEDGQSRRRL